MFTANAFAILSLRAMYFLLADLIHRFIYLKIGLALVLIWVGIKMFLKIDVYYIPTPVSLGVIAAILMVSVAASLWVTRGQGRRPLSAPARAPFGTASPDEMAALEPLMRRHPRHASEAGTLEAGPHRDGSEEATPLHQDDELDRQAPGKSGHP